MNTLVICRRINYIERKYTTSKVAGALNKKVNKNKKPHKGPSSKCRKHTTPNLFLARIIVDT